MVETSIVRVPFHGDYLEALQEGQDVWVNLKRGCENIGLAPHGQAERLENEPWATTRVMRVVAEDGKTREMLMLHIDSFPMWLATIQSKRIKNDAVRLKVELYQKEAAAVLRNHFFGDRNRATGIDYENMFKMFMTVVMPAMATTIASAVTTAVRETISDYNHGNKFDDRTIGLAGKKVISERLKEYTEIMVPDNKLARRRFRAGVEVDLRAKIGHTGVGSVFEKIPIEKWEDVNRFFDEKMREASRLGKTKQLSLF